MSTNKDLAQRLEQISHLLELTGANPFRSAANARAARAIADLPEEIASFANDRKRILAIEGVGKGVADKVQEFVRTGDIAERTSLLAEIPAGLLDVLKVPGLGPKTVRAIWQTANVTNIPTLKEAITSGALESVPRLGKKSIDNIKASIDFTERAGDRTPLGQASMIADILIERLANIKGAQKIQAAGSLRRGKETIGDIDILIATNDPTAVSEAFRTMPEVDDVIAAGETKSSVRLTADLGPHTPACTIQADLRVVPLECFGAALLYFTGSKEHNVRLRERAQKLNLTLNEYGLYPEDKDPKPPQKRNIKPVATLTEKDIYTKLGLPYLPPEIREDRGELDLKNTPTLIETKDIQSELHAHTTASDGILSIEELAEEAKRRGYHTIAVTDHSKAQAVANGLSVERMRAHLDAIREADANIKGIKILAGAEVDILVSGKLDYDDELLAQMDIVVASPHMGLRMEPKKATKRLLRAIQHPLVDIIGHPTGRLIGKREGMSPDMNELIAAAKEHDTALEINAHWKRLDLRDSHVRAAHEAGALISINCDTHRPEHMDNLRFAIATARRGWLPPKRCINTWPAPKLHRWLKERRASYATT